MLHTLTIHRETDEDPTLWLFDFKDQAERARAYALRCERVVFVSTVGVEYITDADEAIAWMEGDQ